MLAPRPNLVSFARPTVAGDAVSFTVDATEHDVLVVVLVGDSAIDVAPAGWVQVSTAAAGGTTWSAWSRSAATDMDDEPQWEFAGGAADPAGMLFVYRDVAPGTVVGPLAAASSAAGTNHVAPAVTSQQATFEELVFWYALTNTVVTPPATVEQLDELSIADAHAQRLLVGRVAPVDAVPTLPTRAGTAAGSTACRMLSVVIRDGLPAEPVELADPVPGNIGLIPS